MEIDHLSKSQIVLLTLFTSFVTSIVTGIVTFSLVSQTPPSVAETVNHVIEHTIEKVTAPVQSASAAASKPLILKESELIPAAVKKANVSTVRLYSDDAGAAFLGLGVVLTRDGGLVADLGMLGDSSGAVVVLPDGARVQASVTARNKAYGLAYLVPTHATGTPTVVWMPIAVTAHPTLGGTAIIISGRSSTRIDSGIITALPAGESDAIFQTNIASAGISGGSPIVDLDGALLGLSTGISRAQSDSAFVSASALLYPVDAR